MTRQEAIGKTYGMSGTKEQHEALEFLVPEIRVLREFYERQQEKEHKSADLTKIMVHKEPYIAPVPIPMVAYEQKPEWSDEDKEKIVTIYEIIEHCTTIPYSGGTLTLNKEYKKELLCFIKSLHPQYHGDVTMTEAYKMGLEAGKASSWKPSEEQMAALEAATVRYQSTGLESLYEDLKKVM